MTDPSIYIEAEEKASKYDEVLEQIPSSVYHTYLINRLKKILIILKKQLYNKLDVDLLVEVYHIANEELEQATSIQDIEAFTRIAHEAKLILIDDKYCETSTLEKN